MKSPAPGIGIAGRRLSILVAILGGLLSSASMGCTRPGQTQASGKANASDRTGAGARQDQAQAASQNRTTGKKLDGAWHHFGERGNASPARPSKANLWRHFGDANTAPKASRRSATAGRQYGASGIREMEKQMFELINRDRLSAAAGGGRLRPLRWNQKLAEIARAHSLDMVRQGYFGHVAPDGRSVVDRLSAAGIAWRAEGENIAMARSADQAEREFMNEPRYQQNHRWNILNRDYTDVGVGIVRRPNGEYYITQDFIESGADR